MYTIADIRTFEVFDSLGFSVSLFRDGYRVATCMDDGFDGPMIFKWGKAAERRIFTDYCKALQGAPSTEWVVCDMTEKLGLDCRKNTLYRVKKDKPGFWRIVKERFSVKVEAVLREQFGDDLVEIANKVNW